MTTPYLKLLRPKHSNSTLNALLLSNPFGSPLTLPVKTIQNLIISPSLNVRTLLSHHQSHWGSFLAGLSAFTLVHLQTVSHPMAGKSLLKSNSVTFLPNIFQWFPTSLLVRAKLPTTVFSCTSSGSCLPLVFYYFSPYSFCSSHTGFLLLIRYYDT